MKSIFESLDQESEVLDIIECNSKLPPKLICISTPHNKDSHFRSIFMADKKKQALPGEQVKAIGSKAKHTIDRKKIGQEIKEPRIKTKDA